MDNERKDGTIAFTEDNEKRFQKMLPHYPTREALMIPALHLILDQYGHISDGMMEYIASRLDLPVSKVMAVCSFYTMLHREKKGTYNIQVCRTLSCAMAGANDIIAHLEKRLGIKEGETTSDGKFTISTAECLASCGTAPVLQVNIEEYQERLTLEKVDHILGELT